MCGIAGISGNPTPGIIKAMVAAMHHRDPDDSGIYHDDGIALGMARLAVIDTTSAGHQPMHNQDGLVWIVYNGETYNFREERSVLEARGHRFESHSDTEVVLRMYEEYGDDFLLRMRGMFALAIHDKRKGEGRERQLLARDQLGIKPLLYCRAGNAFLFASELKSILTSGLVKRQVDPEALRLLLTFGSVTQPHTMISGVKMLLPGHRLILENGRERIERFWQLDVGRRAEVAGLPYPELVSLVCGSLDESMRLPRSAKLGSLASVQSPETASYRDTGTRKILVDIGAGLLPPGMDRFSMPFGAWMKGPLREVFDDALSSATVKNRGLFDEFEVSRLKEDFLAGKGSWPQPWLLMMTELWCREVLDQPRVAGE